VHLPSKEELEALPAPTAEKPWRILVSACLTGCPCGVDGTSYGAFPWIKALLELPTVAAVSFCPEDFAFGTPRSMPDIHGGDGFDVLDGTARVLTETGEDWTAGFVEAAERMLHLAREHAVDLAILMDMSAACGTQVISDGCRLVAERRYRKGPGVAAALLIRHGFRVVSQRDFRTLELVRKKLDRRHVVDEAAVDHHETEWYRSYFT
jgi:uncharacterized protein YbbK (DUF523 family)